MESPADYQRKKKKSKKSYLQKARRYGVRGILGRGRQIDQDTYDYYVRVLDTLNREAWDDEEGQAMFIANVFQQTEGEEWTLCGNQLCSRVLEKLLPFAQAAVRERFMSALAQDLRLTCTDAFSSHILERLLLLACFAPPTEADDDFRTFAQIWVLKVTKFVINNWDDFCPDVYASHILRTAFQCLSGIKLPVDVLRSRHSRNQVTGADQSTTFQDFEPTADSLAVLKLAAVKAKQMQNRDEVLHTDAAAGVVATLVTILCRKLPPTGRDLAQELLDQVLPRDLADEVPVVFQSEGLTRLLEALISECPAELVHQIHAQFFRSRLSRLARHATANFAVQKLLTACPDKATFETWYGEELDEQIEEIFASGNTGVILNIAKTCRKMSAKQAHFLVALMKALHCYEPVDQQTKLVPLLVHLRTKEGMEETTERMTVHIHGSLILQELLQFSKPIKAVSSLLAMDSSALKNLLSDPKGNYVTQTFMSSPTVGEKSRESLVKSLHGELVAMACSKHGSRSVDAIWSKTSLKGKEIVASELSQKEPLLNSNQFGKFIAQNCALSSFKRARDDWKANLLRTDKKRDMFQDIIGDLGDATQKPKPKAKVNDIEPPLSPTPKKEKKKKRKKADLAEDILALDEDATTNSPEVESIPKKKKKKKAKSYLDDL
ncbi:hypothetical protein TCAL_00913 [Tigriopus californicus]|uniref:Nucleolar protein 9 n=1 Tax=Tigriopus californicus TaxID=6832 RepID=A0A553P7N8_TIGCA|nr:nucleolar protein 9-like [Tigriopus californicus]TRY73701.1 hypothetical protein TCAL_00913 [Tigriopus californicus]|eukprot:TCALIF_00913-PA protein Name:"Similar to Nop9 Nucleolar protein 9 (Mus musculus)" AED:0.18 eAED:0.18 QI:154/1/1/1/1/1/5/39/662